MSSFMVSDESLRKIATVLRDCMVQKSSLLDKINTYPIVTDELRDLCDVAGDDERVLYDCLYMKLHAMNVEALFARYDDPEDMCAPIDEIPKPIEGLCGGVLWDEEYPLWNKPAFVKTCQCYLYQCDESDEIVNSTLFKAVEALEHQVALAYVESTPQYENADWA